MGFGIEEGVELLGCGGVVTYPTETFFGLGADPFHHGAVEEVAQLKTRELQRGIPLIISDSEWVENYIANESDGVRENRLALQAQYWPGPLTIVFTVRADRRSEFSPLVFGPDFSLAVRVSSHSTARELARGVGGAITSTSANLAGETPAVSNAEAKAIFPHIPSVEGVVGGETKPSTIIDVRAEPFVVLRQGAIAL